MKLLVSWHLATKLRWSGHLLQPAATIPPYLVLRWFRKNSGTIQGPCRRRSLVWWQGNSDDGNIWWHLDIIRVILGSTRFQQLGILVFWWCLVPTVVSSRYLIPTVVDSSQQQVWLFDSSSYWSEIPNLLVRRLQLEWHFKLLLNRVMPQFELEWKLGLLPNTCWDIK